MNQPDPPTVPFRHPGRAAAPTTRVARPRPPGRPTSPGGHTRQGLPGRPGTAGPPASHPVPLPSTPVGPGGTRRGRRGRRAAVLIGLAALLAVAALVAVLLGTGIVPQSTRTAAGSLPAGPLPTTRVTPYADMTGFPPPDLAAYVRATGQRDVVLSFALAGPGGCDQPTWGGTVPIGDPATLQGVAALRAAGGHAVAATGGELGTYLESVCPDAAALARAYRSVLDAANTNDLDVDVEAPLDSGRVADALAEVQQERGTTVTLTLPVESRDAALTAAGTEMLRAVAARGVAVRTNIMAMNFPDEGDWRGAMIGAVDSAARQLGEVWPGADPAELRHRLGVTMMIGRNDDGMVTTPEDAAAVVAHARQQGLGSVGFWSLTRDSGSCPTATAAREDCSGVEQAPFGFTAVLRGVG